MSFFFFFTRHCFPSTTSISSVAHSSVCLQLTTFCPIIPFSQTTTVTPRCKLFNSPLSGSPSALWVPVPVLPLQVHHGFIRLPAEALRSHQLPGPLCPHLELRDEVKQRRCMLVWFLCRVFFWFLHTVLAIFASLNSFELTHLTSLRKDWGNRFTVPTVLGSMWVRQTLLIIKRDLGVSTNSNLKLFKCNSLPVFKVILVKDRKTINELDIYSWITHIYIYITLCQYRKVIDEYIKVEGKMNKSSKMIC